MKRIWKILHWKLPDCFDYLPKLVLALMVLALLSEAFYWHSLQEKTKNQIAFIRDSYSGLTILEKHDVQTTLQAILWRRGDTWEALSDEVKNVRRHKALDSVIDDLLIANFSKAKANDDSPSLHRESEEAFQQFLKQFPPPDEWKQRLEQQGLTETKLRERISRETKHLSAIENWLAQQPGKVTEADARAWFDTHKNSLTIPERVRASHIFLTRLADKDTGQDREPKIRELHKKLLTKEATLEDLARQFSDDDGSKPRGGDLGWFSRHRMPPEFAEKVFALPVGEISAPFESHLGWHILVVQEKRPARVIEFAEVQNEITAMLESQWREATLQRLMQELRAKAKIEMFESRIKEVQPSA